MLKLMGKWRVKLWAVFICLRQILEAGLRELCNVLRVETCTW